MNNVNEHLTNFSKVREDKYKTIPVGKYEPRNPSPSKITSETRNIFIDARNSYIRDRKTNEDVGMISTQVTKSKYHCNKCKATVLQEAALKATYIFDKGTKINPGNTNEYANHNYDHK